MQVFSKSCFSCLFWRGGRVLLLLLLFVFAYIGLDYFCVFQYRFLEHLEFVCEIHYKNGKIHT